MAGISCAEDTSLVEGVRGGSRDEIGDEDECNVWKGR